MIFVLGAAALAAYYVGCWSLCKAAANGDRIARGE